MKTDLDDFVKRTARSIFLARKSIIQRVAGDSRSERAVLFVAGVQRSGTNMLMDVLEHSMQTQVFHERDPRAFDNYQLRDLKAIHRIVDNSPAQFVVIKCLMESQKLAVLLDNFQGSTAVWMFRHFNDVVNSMLISFKNQAKQVLRIANDRNSDGWLGDSMSDETHNLVRELARPGLDDASAAAIQWYFRNVRFFEQGFEHDPRVRLLNYDKLVADPKSEIESILVDKELEYHPRLIKYVNAQSVRKREPPDIRNDVNSICMELYDRLCAAAAIVQDHEGSVNVSDEMPHKRTARG